MTSTFVSKSCPLNRVVDFCIAESTQSFSENTIAYSVGSERNFNRPEGLPGSLSVLAINRKSRGRTGWVPHATVAADIQSIAAILTQPIYYATVGICLCVL